MYMGIPLKDRIGKSILNSEANIKIHIKKYRFGGGHSSSFEERRNKMEIK